MKKAVCVFFITTRLNGGGLDLPSALKCMLCAIYRYTAICSIRKRPELKAGAKSCLI